MAYIAPWHITALKMDGPANLAFEGTLGHLGNVIICSRRSLGTLEHLAHTQTIPVQKSGTFKGQSSSSSKIQGCLTLWWLMVIQKTG